MLLKLWVVRIAQGAWGIPPLSCKARKRGIRAVCCAWLTTQHAPHMPRPPPHLLQNQFVRPGFELGFKVEDRYYIYNHLVGGLKSAERVLGGGVLGCGGCRHPAWAPVQRQRVCWIVWKERAC